MKVLLLVCLIGYVAAIPVDNGVDGDPEIECGPTAITVSFNTQNNFAGHTYVKGRYSEAGCRTDSSDRQVATIQLPFDSCGVKRERSLNPKGVFVSTTVIISFHPLFVTKVDRAFKIQCFYMEADKTVSTELEVSMLTTAFQSQVVQMPICRYEIHKDGPDGEIIQFALVGEQVYHKWICDSPTTDTFCMTVHSCFVDDGNGDKADLINLEGCAIDVNLMNNIEYPADLMGGVEAHVFKYADRTQLYFNCQITLLVKEPNQECVRPTCSTPPGRGGGGAVAPAGGAAAPRRKRRQALPAVSDNTLDVHADMSTLDIDDNETRSLPQRRLPALSYEPTREISGFCLSSSGFTFFLVAAVALIAAVVVVSLALLFRSNAGKA